jgi:N-acetylglucosaminyldiphosphoundecaprenol N-acetyl-beta-D-mannosaminyltransferase
MDNVTSQEVSTNGMTYADDPAISKKQFLGFPISIGKYQEFIQSIISEATSRRSNYMCVANVHMLVEAYNNPEFASVLRNAGKIIPDGQPIIWGLRLLYGIKQDRVAGMDLLPDLMVACMDHQLSIYIYGSTPELLGATETHLTKNYPQLSIAGLYSPPFRKLTHEEENNIVNSINASGANIVFVVLGCPKQEKWMAFMKGRINSCMIGVGGALPVMVGLQKRAPVWMQNNGLEWLYRLIQEPGRLFKRYAITNSVFIFLLLRECFSVKVLRKAIT